MYLIKRYSNRKLYDTVRKRYLTLKEIGDLVAQGRDIQIIDNETGADLTNQTLSQVIYEQEKKQQGFLSKDLLTNLIQKGGNFLNRLPHSLQSFLNPQDDGLDLLLARWQEDGILEEEHLPRVREDLFLLYSEEKLSQLLEEVLRDFDLPQKDDLEHLRSLLADVENEWLQKKKGKKGGGDL